MKKVATKASSFIRKETSQPESDPSVLKKSTNIFDDPKLTNCFVRVKKLDENFKMKRSLKAIKEANKQPFPSTGRVSRQIVKPLKYRNDAVDNEKPENKKSIEALVKKSALTKKAEPEPVKIVIEPSTRPSRTRSIPDRFKKDVEKKITIDHQKTTTGQESNKISVPVKEKISKEKDNIKNSKETEKLSVAKPKNKDIPAETPTLMRAKRSKVVPIRFRLDKAEPAKNLDPVVILKELEPRIQLKNLQPKINLKIGEPEGILSETSSKESQKVAKLVTTSEKSIQLRSSAKKSQIASQKPIVSKKLPILQSVSEIKDHKKSENSTKTTQVVSNKRVIGKAELPQPQAKRLKEENVSVFNKPKSPLRKLALFSLANNADDDDNDIYDFNSTQPLASSSIIVEKKIKPLKRLNPRPKAGNRMQTLMKQSTMNIVSGSCSVLHNPDLFKVAKEAIEKSLKAPVRDRAKMLQKVINPPIKKITQSMAPINKEIFGGPQTSHQQKNMEYDEILPEPKASKRQNRIPNPKVKDLRSQLQISHSNKSLVAKTHSTPYRINVDNNLPTAFYFGLNKDNVPSFSSDSILIPESDDSPDKSGFVLKVVADVHTQCENTENETAESLQKNVTLNSMQGPPKGDSDYDEDFVDQENLENIENDQPASNQDHQLGDTSILNHSDAENIAPVMLKTPTKKRPILQTLRSPLKTLAVTPSLIDSIILSTTIPPSPLTVFSYTEKPSSKVIILDHQILPKDKEFIVNSPEKTVNTTKTSSLIEKNTDNVFGFDELISESLQEGAQEKSVNKSNERLNIKDNLKKLKEYLPSKLKKLETSPEKRVELSKPLNLFKSPLKLHRDIREMFHSTPVNQFKKPVFDDSAPGTSKAAIEADKLKELSLSKSRIESSTLVNSSEDEITEDFNDDEDLSISLFDDPSQVGRSKDESFKALDKTKIKRNYGRKRRRVVFSDAEDEGALSSEEEVERVAKKRKKPEKPDVVNTHEFQKFVRSMNEDFAEVDVYELIVEQNIQK